MKGAKVCPKCGSLVYFNSYFGAYICENCSWEDASYAQERDSLCVIVDKRAVVCYKLLDKKSIPLAKKRQSKRRMQLIT